MAFASSSATPQLKYDVFLSFRGEDTRSNFTGHLYAALCRAKIETFIDNQLNRGDEISSSLLNTIKASKISVIIFSKNYADSRWCLKELEQILECKRRCGQIVIPVFYHVDPSNVRNLKGKFGDSFLKLQERFKEKLDELQRWKAALEEAASLCGCHIKKNEKPEYTIIDDTVGDILKILNKLSSSQSKDLVGVECAIQKIESLLQIESNGIGIIGIWGIGGIGKTTIGRAVFDKILSKFEGSFFFENVREESDNNRLIHLQKEFLYSILEGGHANSGFPYTKERLGRIKVLIVFDDVTCSGQIQKLIGDLNCLGSGSRIIITSRDKQVLQNCGVIDANIFEVKELCNEDALRLFRRYAFRQNYPTQDYMELSSTIVKYTKGVPLALKVLGSCLLGKTEKEWISEVDKLGKAPHEDIQRILKISYDRLDYEEKNIFLYISCFFNGCSRLDLEQILDALGFSTHIGVSTLIDKSLITMSSRANILMHDLLQDMGKEIVRQESIIDPGKRSRLWDHNDISDVFRKNTGTAEIRAICLDTTKISDIRLNSHVFANMPNLSFFKVYGRQHKLYGFDDLEYFSAKIFSWERYPSKSLPLKFQMEDLVRLEMPYNNFMELWTGVQNVVSLKHINLGYSKHLTEIPNLSKALNLEELILRNCESLSNLPDGIQSKFIDLSCCVNLKIVPKISYKVEELDLRETAIKELPSIEEGSRLIKLNLSFCSRLERLSSSICNCEHLKFFALDDCRKLERLPDDIGNLKALEIFGTQGILLREVPSSIIHLSKLSSLYLSLGGFKEGINWVPNSLSGLRSLKRLQLVNCQMSKLPDDLGQLSFLEKLDLSGNNFESIPASIKDLSNLHFLNISHCDMLQYIPKLPSGVNVTSFNCSSLISISKFSFTFSPGLVRIQRVNFSNCFQRDLSKILQESPAKLCDCVFDPGHEKPTWFTFEGSESSGEVKKRPLELRYKKIIGLNICTVVALPQRFNVQQKFTVNFISSGYNLRLHSRLWNDNYSSSDLFDYKYHKNDHGNKMAFYGNRCVLKRCGVQFLYAQEEEDEPYSRPRPKYFAEFPKDINKAVGYLSLETLHFLVPFPSRRAPVDNIFNFSKWNVLKIHKESFEGVHFDCYRGSKIPKWFSFKGRGSSMMVKQPPEFKNKIILGFIMCAVLPFPERFNFSVTFSFAVVHSAF